MPDPRTDKLLLPLLSLAAPSGGIATRTAFRKATAMPGPAGEALRSPEDGGGAKGIDLLEAALDRLEASELIERLPKSRYRLTAAGRELLESGTPEMRLKSLASTTPTRSRPKSAVGTGAADSQGSPLPAPQEGAAAGCPNGTSGSGSPADAGQEDARHPSAPTPPSGGAAVPPPGWPFKRGVDLRHLPKRGAINAAVLVVIARRIECESEQLRSDVLELLGDAGLPASTRRTSRFRDWFDFEMDLSRESLEAAGLVSRHGSSSFRITDLGRNIVAELSVKKAPHPLKPLPGGEGTPPGPDAGDPDSPPGAVRPPGWPSVRNRHPGKRPLSFTHNAAVLTVMSRIGEADSDGIREAVYELFPEVGPRPRQPGPHEDAHAVDRLIQGAVTDLSEAGLLEETGGGRYRITDAGRETLNPGRGKNSPESLSSPLSPARGDPDGDRPPQVDRGADGPGFGTADPLAREEECLERLDRLILWKLESLLRDLEPEPLFRLALLVAEEADPEGASPVFAVAGKPASAGDVADASAKAVSAGAMLFAPHGMDPSALDALAKLGSGVEAFDGPAMARLMVKFQIGVPVIRRLRILEPDEEFFNGLEGQPLP
ncbi:MAG: winged helix-turn-helix domain-containing protein [Deltaproteobacteria bacterium]|jgi:DNA-binding PadR family transcriptional regulator|nr:winged helix-turn-helix domain-containing protein [Deltaproteobacteria bacterium]